MPTSGVTGEMASVSAEAQLEVDAVLENNATHVFDCIIFPALDDNTDDIPYAPPKLGQALDITEHIDRNSADDGIVYLVLSDISLKEQTIIQWSEYVSDWCKRTYDISVVVRNMIAFDFEKIGHGVGYACVVLNPEIQESERQEKWLADFIEASITDFMRQGATVEQIKDLIASNAVEWQPVIEKYRLLDNIADKNAKDSS